MVLPASVMQLILYHRKVEVSLLNNEKSVGFVAIYSLFVSLQPEIEICIEWTNKKHRNSKVLPVNTILSKIYQTIFLNNNGL